MTRQDPNIATVSEAAAIVGLINARLDALANGQADGIAAADARLEDRPGGSCVSRIVVLFDLDAFDRAILLTAIAPLFDATLAARYQQISSRPWATEWLAAQLFGLNGELFLGVGSRLFAWRLVTASADQLGEPPALIADAAMRAWIQGRFDPEPMLAGAIRIAEPLPPLPDWPVDDTARRIEAIAEGGIGAVLVLDGLEGAGRATFAACVAEMLSRPALVISPDARPDWSADSALRAHRYAIVTGAALVWRGPVGAGELAPPGLPPLGLQAVTLNPGEDVQIPATLAHLPLSLPPLDQESRARLISQLLPGSVDWPQDTCDRLVRRPALTPGILARIARTAPAGPEQAVKAANATGATAMGDLATRMPTTLVWDDLILDPDRTEALKDLAHEAAIRSETWEQPELRRLFGREAGLNALFHGPSGTGKTMAAQVLAGELGFDLYRIDCASVVSKYIGETAKNLRAIFARARAIDAVLFFDEAEALFSRRTEVRDSNDRHANADTSYLLQLIEGGFEGLAILATNRMRDMDSAFLRRIRYVLDFQRPGPDVREVIWRRAGTALYQDRAEELAPLWPVLAQSLDVTGAQIKAILLSAHFKAARYDIPVSAEHLVAAAARELAKDGRTLSTREMSRIRAHA